MKKKLIKSTFWFICLLMTNVQYVISQNYVCNEGFEYPNSFLVYPSSPNQVPFLDCWDSDPSFPYHSPDWYYSPTDYRLQEDLDADGVFEDILGVGESRGYIGMIPGEGIFQKLSNDLVKNEVYGLNVKVRVPNGLNRIYPDTLFSVNPAYMRIDLEITFSMNELQYAKDSADCRQPDKAYKLSGEGTSGKQIVTHTIDFSQLASGNWHEVLVPPFLAEKDWKYIFIQFRIDNVSDNECAQYALIDDVQIIGDCNFSECETCTYVDGIINPSSNSVNTGQEPLEFYGMTNISSAAISVQQLSTGHLVHLESFYCSDGWVNDTLQINLDYLAVGYYETFMLFSNDCNACLLKDTFYYSDDYNQTFEACTCRTENLIRPCCKNEVELEEPGITCSTPPTLNYEVVDDLLVGVSNDFEVPANVHLNLIAGNSIHFGPKFLSGQGTFRAEVIPCSSNKRLQGENAFKNEDESNESHFSNELFKVFPNPAEGQFIVQNLTDLPGQLKIIDLEGRLVKTFELSSSASEIIQPQFSNGVYFVQFQNDYGQYSEKLVISSP